MQPTLARSRHSWVSINEGIPAFNLVLKWGTDDTGPGMSATWSQSSLGHSILQPVTMLLPFTHNIRKWLS